MDFEIVGDISHAETFATGSSTREIARLRKLKLPDGATRLAELHWYEAHGIGRKEFKIKRYID